MLCLRVCFLGIYVVRVDASSPSKLTGVRGMLGWVLRDGLSCVRRGVGCFRNALIEKSVIIIYIVGKGV